MGNLVIDGHKVHFEYGQKKVSFFSRGIAKQATRPVVKCVVSNAETNEEVVTAEV